MGKKKTIDRHESYELNEFRSGHLLMLSNRLVSFIDAMRPAFARAEKAISGAHDSKEYIADCVRAGEPPSRYRSANDLLGWLEHKAVKLAELTVKVEDGATNLDGKALNNLRQIRAFFIRFENVAKSEYGGKSYFQTAEPILSKLLLEKLVPARHEGGVFAITRFVLRTKPSIQKMILVKFAMT